MCSIAWGSRKFPRPARSAPAAEAQAAVDAMDTDNQPKDKRTAIDVAVLRRSVDMNLYSIMWRPDRSQLTDPFTKQGACCDKLRQALISGQVDLGF